MTIDSEHLHGATTSTLVGHSAQFDDPINKRNTKVEEMISEKYKKQCVKFFPLWT